jgi:Spy/CpxP family protein refolding chaperone
MDRTTKVYAVWTGRLFIAICLICLGFIVANPVSAEEWGHHGDRGKEGHFRHKGEAMRLLMKLDLNDSQKAAIREIRDSTAKEVIKKKAEAKIAKIELRELLRKDPVDMRAVESQLRKIGDIKISMVLDRIRSREEIKSKLTPEQREKFKELMRDSMSHRRFREHRS